ncbi:MAG: hypothetical protein ACERKD_10990 [Prolixibacteraceae bacterium]
MRLFTLIILFTILFGINGIAQIKFPVEYRVEKQSMSTPMSLVEDIFFLNYYYSRPVNVRFDGANLDMFYDNGASVAKKELTKVNHTAEYEEGVVSLETFYYTDKTNVSDTILFVVDYNVRYVQMILPTKNSKNENIGFTSLRKFVNVEELALN